MKEKIKKAMIQLSEKELVARNLYGLIGTSCVLLSYFMVMTNILIFIVGFSLWEIVPIFLFVVATIGFILSAMVYNLCVSIYDKINIKKRGDK